MSFDVVSYLIGDINSKSAKEEAAVAAAIADKVYPGLDLRAKFADEIAEAPYSGDEWAWIKARITSGNYEGIHVGDYIPITTTEPTPQTLNAQIIGIDTYTGYGDTEVGHHIDWCCKELWSTRHSINKANYNNGVPAFTPEGGTEQPEVEYPWLACDLYHWLNSLSGYVPSSTTLNPTMAAVDYTSNGVYYYLPAKLKAQIIEKRAYLPKRYSASGLLSDDNAGGWTGIGKLWLPSEFEVYGAPVWGGKGGYATMGNSIQYPYFAGNMNRVKKRSGSRDAWWVLSVSSGSTTSWCYVNTSGIAYYTGASSTYIAAPVCFRT